MEAAAAIESSRDETDFEWHIPMMHFCGPGTDLTRRLQEYGKTPKPDSMPVDRIDEAALRHDLYYTEHKDARSRVEGDRIMIEEVRSIKDPSCRECFERAIVISALVLKRFFTRLILSIIDYFSQHRSG